MNRNIHAPFCGKRWFTLTANQFRFFDKSPFCDLHLKEIKMADPKKSAAAVKKIQDLQRLINNHQANITNIERDKANKIKYCDQQIRSQQDEIRKYNKQIDDLKRLI